MALCHGNSQYIAATVGMPVVNRPCCMAKFLDRRFEGAGRGNVGPIIFQHGDHRHIPIMP
jgi:hypothetical protein